MQEYDQADFYVQELKILATELQSNLFLAGYYCYGAPIKSHRGADEEALADLAKSLSIFKAMGVAEGEEDVYTFQYRIHRKLKRYAEALFDDDEIKRIQKEANFGGRSIEIQRKEFQSQILADSMKVVDEKREIEYQRPLFGKRSAQAILPLAWERLFCCFQADCTAVYNLCGSRKLQ